MKKGFWRVIMILTMSLICCLCFAACDGCSSCGGDDGYKGSHTENGVVYDLYEDRAVVTGVEKYAGKIEIAAEVEGTPVTAIANRAFYRYYYIQEIVIPESVTTIGSEAFYACKGLNSITVPSGVTSIGADAFGECGALIEVNNKSALTVKAGSEDYGKLGYYAKHVYGEGGQSYIKTEGDFVFYDDGADKSLLGYNGTATEITLPTGNYDVYTCAFYAARDLTKVTVPEGVTAIGDYAFNACEELATINLPNTLVTVGNYAFNYCKTLNNVDMPDSVRSLGDYVFNWNFSLTSMEIPEGVEVIGSNAFNTCVKLETISIPDSVNTIKSGAFVGCDNLEFYTNEDGKGNGAYYLGNAENNYLWLIEALGTKVTKCEVEQSTKGIIENAFAGCINLKEITIHGNVKSIGNNAFYQCNALTSVNIDSITDWCNIEFASANANPLGSHKDTSLRAQGKKVTAVKIPEGVTAIKDYAFYGYQSMVSIDIPNSVVSIKSSAFENLNLEKFKPNSGTDKLIYYLGNAQNPYLWLWDTKHTAVAECDVEMFCYGIMENAFSGCSNLTNVTLPANLQVIGENAFDGCHKLIEVCNQSSLAIEAGSEEFGKAGYYAKNICANEDDSKLSVVTREYTVGEGDNAASYVEEYKFYTDGDECYLLGWASTTNKSEIALPVLEEGKTYEIYEYAFYDRTDLKAIVIPESVTYIQDNAFYNCIQLTLYLDMEAIPEAWQKTAEDEVNENWNGGRDYKLLGVWTKDTVTGLPVVAAAK